MSRSSLQKILDNDLFRIESDVTRVLQKNMVPGIRSELTYISRIRGKKLRPIFVMLVARALNGRSPCTASTYEQLIKVSVALELLHQASLIHDDIIDRSDRRHNQKSAFKKYGSDSSIVIGDLLISAASEVVAGIKKADVRYLLMRSFSNVCVGQLLQMNSRDSLTMTSRQYMRIISLKTASLFSAACESAALLVKPRMLNTLSSFGVDVGIAFQVKDDLEDLLGDPLLTGKPVGQDIKNGEMTLPTILLIKNAGVYEKKVIKQIISKKNSKSVRAMITRLKGSRSLNLVCSTITHHVNNAKKSLKTLPHTEVRTELEYRIVKLTDTDVCAIKNRQ